MYKKKNMVNETTESDSKSLKRSLRKYGQYSAAQGRTDPVRGRERAEHPKGYSKELPQLVR